MTRKGHTVGPSTLRAAALLGHRHTLEALGQLVTLKWTFINVRPNGQQKSLYKGPALRACRVWNTLKHKGHPHMAPSAYYLRWQSHMLPGQNTRRCTDWTLANLSAKLMYLRDVRVLLNMLLQTVILCKLSSILGGICRSVHVL